MGSNLHGTFAALLMSSAIVLASGSMAAPSADATAGSAPAGVGAGADIQNPPDQNLPAGPNPGVDATPQSPNSAPPAGRTLPPPNSDPNRAGAEAPPRTRSMAARSPGAADDEFANANPALGEVAKSLGKTSTRNAGLKGRAKARVEQKEETITRDLNRASATGNANVSSLTTNSSTGGANIGTP